MQAAGGQSLVYLLFFLDEPTESCSAVILVGRFFPAGTRGQDVPDEVCGWPFPLESRSPNHQHHGVQRRREERVGVCGVGLKKTVGGKKNMKFEKRKKCQTVVSRSTVTSRTSARMAWYSLDSWRMVARRARRAAFSSGATPGSGSMRACSKRPAISSRAFKSVGVTSRPLRRRSTSKLNTDSHDTGAFFATNAKGGAPGAPTCAAIAAVPCVSGTGRGGDEADSYARRSGGGALFLLLLSPPPAAAHPCR